MRRLVGIRLDERDVDLKRRVAQKSYELRFRCFFGGHEIENCNLYGAYVLPYGASLVHNENLFVGEAFERRQTFGNNYRHNSPIYCKIGILSLDMCVVKRLFDVVDEIERVFESAREAHEIGRHSCVLKFAVGELTVG